MASFNQALRHRPGLYQAHRAIGSVHLRHGRHDEAPPAIELALLVEPRQVEALNNRGLVFRATQRHAQALARWASVLDARCFNIGICRQGNPARKIDAGRSIALRQLEPLARVPGVRLVSLQKQFGLEQLQDLPGSMQVRQLDGFDEGPDAFMDSAAALQTLDLLVTADTFITHVAGATGRAGDWSTVFDDMANALALLVPGCLAVRQA